MTIYGGIRVVVKSMTADVLQVLNHFLSLLSISTIALMFVVSQDLLNDIDPHGEFVAEHAENVLIARLDFCSYKPLLFT